MSALDLHARPTLATRVRLQTDPVTGDPVLLYPEGVLQLNETAHAIVTRSNGSTTVEQIIEELAAEYETTRDEIAGDVLECLQELHRRNLIGL